MFAVILLLILAVLLFGSSAVLGAIGWILGFIVAAIAMVWLSIALEVEPGLVIIFCVAGFFGLLGLTYVVASILQPYEIKRMKRKQEEEQRRARSKRPAGPPMSEDYRKAYESIQFRARAKRSISDAEREASRDAAASPEFEKKRPTKPPM